MQRKLTAILALSLWYGPLYAYAQQGIAVFRQSSALPHHAEHASLLSHREESLITHHTSPA